MARNDVQVSFRAPVDLKEWLDNLAEANLRSVNNEIVLALREKRERLTGENPA